MWTSWWCSFRSCFSFVQSSEHTSSVAQSKADFHAHTRRSQKHKKCWYYTCLSVCPLRTHIYSFVDLSEQTKQSSKVFQRFQFEQKFLYSKNSSTSKSVPCIVVVNAHCSGPQKENRHLHSLCLFFSQFVLSLHYCRSLKPQPQALTKRLWPWLLREFLATTCSSQLRVTIEEEEDRSTQKIFCSFCPLPNPPPPPEKTKKNKNSTNSTFNPKIFLSATSAPAKNTSPSLTNSSIYTPWSSLHQSSRDTKQNAKQNRKLDQRNHNPRTILVPFHTKKKKKKTPTYTLPKFRKPRVVLLLLFLSPSSKSPSSAHSQTIVDFLLLLLLFLVQNSSHRSTTSFSLISSSCCHFPLSCATGRTHTQTHT